MNRCHIAGFVNLNLLQSQLLKMSVQPLRAGRFAKGWRWNACDLHLPPAQGIFMGAKPGKGVVHGTLLGDLHESLPGMGGSVKYRSSAFGRTHEEKFYRRMKQ